MFLPCGSCPCCIFLFFFFNDTATTEIYTLSLHDALPIYLRNALASIWRMRSRVTANDCPTSSRVCSLPSSRPKRILRSEEHTSELQSRLHLVCRLLLEKKKNNNLHTYMTVII